MHFNKCHWDFTAEYNFYDFMTTWFLYEFLLKLTCTIMPCTAGSLFSFSTDCKTYNTGRRWTIYPLYIMEKFNIKPTTHLHSNIIDQYKAEHLCAEGRTISNWMARFFFQNQALLFNPSQGLKYLCLHLTTQGLLFFSNKCEFHGIGVLNEWW